MSSDVPHSDTGLIRCLRVSQYAFSYSSLLSLLDFRPDPTADASGQDAQNLRQPQDPAPHGAQGQLRQRPSVRLECPGQGEKQNVKNMKQLHFDFVIV